jgi:hypothetical protein
MAAPFAKQNSALAAEAASFHFWWLICLAPHLLRRGTLIVAAF